MELYIFKLMLAALLGVVIAWGLKEKSNFYCFEFILMSFGLGVVLSIGHHALGNDVVDLLLLEMPSKSTAAFFLIYSGIFGGLIRIIISLLRTRVSARR